jgi:hypothetical protein
VIVRIWRTGIDPARAEDYERAERVVPSFWEDVGAVPTHREAVDALLATGILTGERAAEVLDVEGGDPPGA